MGPPAEKIVRSDGERLVTVIVTQGGTGGATADGFVGSLLDRNLTQSPALSTCPQHKQNKPDKPDPKNT